jgi:hypothetical protein
MRIEINEEPFCGGCHVGEIKVFEHTGSCLVYVCSDCGTHTVVGRHAAFPWVNLFLVFLFMVALVLWLI